MKPIKTYSNKALVNVLNVLTLLSAAFAIFCDYAGHSGLFRIFKPLTTILIILIPLLHRNKSYIKYALFVLIGLLFCLVGDVFLLYENQFVFGLVSFLIAHIMFTIAFISIDKWKKYFLSLIVLLVFGTCYYIFIYSGLHALAIPVLCYFIFIIVMCWQGIALYILRKTFVFKLIAIAVILFLISDSIIAFTKFKMPFEFSGILVLGTYWLALSLLANSTIIIEKTRRA